jgi:hypothetical protein
MAADKCGNFEITGTGIRRVDSATVSADQAQAMSRCWK